MYASRNKTRQEAGDFMKFSNEPLYFPMKSARTTTVVISGKTHARAALVLTLLLALYPCAAPADLYVYVGPDGTRWITDHHPGDPGYKMIKRYGRKPAAVRCLKPASRGLRRRLQKYASTIDSFAARHGIDEALVKAVIYVESCYEPRAHSRAGAVGLMQLMPETARHYGVTDRYDPVQNIKGGVRFLKYLMRRFGNDLRLVLAAYNAGETAVRKYGGVPPYHETRRYVPRVLRYYEFFRQNA
jgi:hypothetical protein